MTLLDAWFSLPFTFHRHFSREPLAWFWLLLLSPFSIIHFFVPECLSTLSSVGQSLQCVAERRLCLGSFSGFVTPGTLNWLFKK